MTFPELPSVINKKGKLVAPEHSLNATKPFPESKSIIKPHLFNYEAETSLIACEKYPIAQLKKLGAGSDRIVYNLEDGNVLKIAKNPRGLLQNTFEVPDYVLKDLVPEVRETGLDYVVVEKLTINRKRANAFLKPLKKFMPRDFDNKTGELQEAFEKMGIDVLLNYDVLFNDIKAPRNWGFRGDKPVLIDTGSLSRDILDKETIAYYKSDWQIILSKRRTCQKKP